MMTDNTGPNNSQSSRAAIEFEPIQIDEQTEVKVPVNPALNNTLSHTVSPMITPNRFLDNEDSDDVYDKDCEIERNPECEAECEKLLELCRDIPRDMFVNRILLDFEQSETKMDEMRTHLFETVRSTENFPFAVESDLKRRINTRSGDSACAKMAYDIHSLLLVIDGDDPCVLKDIISIAKKTPRHSSKPIQLTQKTTDKCACSAEIAHLKDTFTSMQADILLVKQRQAASENLKTSEIQSVIASVQNFNFDMNKLKQTVQENFNELKTCINDLDSASQQRLGVCNTHFTSNSKTIISLQQSVIRVKTSLDEISQKLNESAQELFQSIDADTPTPIEDETRPGRMVDAATQYDVHDTSQETPSVCETRLPHSYADIVTNACVNKSTAENLIDLDVGIATPSPTCTNHVLDPLTASGNTESDLCFGNSKIPTVITDPNQRKNRGRRQRQRQKRNINFAIIRKEVANAENLRERRMQQSYNDDAYDARVDDADDFEQYVRKRTKRYFVNGFLPSITESKIAKYVSDRDLKCTKVSIFRKTRNNRINVIIRVNVEDDGNADALIDDPYFWPRGVTCRPWMSPNELRQRRENNYGTLHADMDDYDHTQHRYYSDDIELGNRFSALDTEHHDID